MSHQIKPSVTNPTIADIYQKITERKLDLAPSFQRRFVWTQEHQEQFIDTIINGFPFPEIYVCQGETDTRKILTTQKVIDGQQRLTTILNYLENNFDKPLSIVTPFPSLDEMQRKLFLNYQIVVRDIGDVEDDVVKEIFRRINITKFKLDDIEIHNAIYDGKFIQLAKELANEIDLSKYEVFYDSEITRMIDTHFFLTILSTLENEGYYSLDKELEKYINQFNEEFPNAKMRKSQILRAFSWLDSMNLNLDSIWFRKSNFFTLVIELSRKNSLEIEGLSGSLQKFEEQVLANKGHASNIYGEYYGYMYSGTNNRKARVKRAEILNNIVLDHF